MTKSAEKQKRNENERKIQNEIELIDYSLHCIALHRRAGIKCLKRVFVYLMHLDTVQKSSFATDVSTGWSSKLLAL